MALTSTVCPVVKSKMRDAGRFEHRVAELVDGRRAFFAGPAGDEVEPVDRRPVGARAERGQRAEVGQLIDLGIGVEGQIAERAEVAVAARNRQVEVDRRLARRPRRAKWTCDAGAVERLLSRCTVLPPSVSVVLASPAGSLNSLPLAVALRSPEAAGLSARGRGERPGRRDRCSVMLRSRSALPVTVQCHCALSPLSAIAGMRAVARRVARERLEQGFAEARSASGLPDARARVLSVAETSPRILRLSVTEPRTSRLVPISERAASAWSAVRATGAWPSRMSRSVSVSMPLPSAWRLKVVRPALVDHQPRDIAVAADIAAVGRGGARELHRGRAEAVAKHDVHDLLVGAIAIFERDFLGQDLDPLDGFGRNVAKLAEAGDPLAVQQQHRPPRRRGRGRCRSAARSRRAAR